MSIKFHNKINIENVKLIHQQNKIGYMIFMAQKKIWSEKKPAPNIGRCHMKRHSDNSLEKNA